MAQNKNNQGGFNILNVAQDVYDIARILSGGFGQQQQPVVMQGAQQQVPPSGAGQPQQPAAQQPPAAPQMSEQDRLRAMLAQLAYMAGGLAQTLTPSYAWQNKLGQFGQQTAQQQLVNLMMKYGAGGGGQSGNPM